MGRQKFEACIGLTRSIHHMLSLYMQYKHIQLGLSTWIRAKDLIANECSLGISATPDSESAQCVRHIVLLALQVL
jgi:hypothetical protein